MGGAALSDSNGANAFNVCGCRFELISEQDWLTLRPEEMGRRRLRERACGRIHIAGQRHIIIAQEPIDLDISSIPRLLTQREYEIAVHVAQGSGNKEIARYLGISHLTVREHIRRICHKLGVHSRSSIAASIGSGVGGSSSR
jgi:DNA-binding CsgD family transcriptional regulator